MNWTAFGVVLAGFVTMAIVIIAMVAVGSWLEKRVGTWWSFAITVGGMMLAFAALVGMTA